METSAGEFTYEIDDIKIVHKDDRTVIVHIDHAVLTLSTCYPFNSVGDELYIYIYCICKVNTKRIDLNVIYTIYYNKKGFTM